MNFVIDTNVIISALYRKPSVPFEVYSFAFNNKNNYVYYSEAIYIEYSKILNRKKFNFSKEVIEGFLSMLKKVGILVRNIDYHYDKKLVDETDRPFYELAKSYNCFLITGNTKHYPKDPIVMLPKDFLNKLQLSA